MPANIPSAIVTGGGNQGPSWPEQLLLTLASQGPGMLMQFLEQRQVKQQAQAIDTADKLALSAFAGAGTSPSEQGAIAGANPQQQGVAGPLLERLQGMRTATSQQRATDTQADVARAGNERAEAQQPGILQGQQESILASQAQRQQSAAELRLAESRLRAEEAMLPIQIEQLKAQISRDATASSLANAQINTLGSSMAAEHRKEFASLLGSLAGTIDPSGVFGGPKNMDEAKAMASELIYGTALVPEGKELDAYYRELVTKGESPDLYSVVKQRIQVRFRMTPERYENVVNLLHASGDDPRAALETARLRGATRQELSDAAIVYSFETGSPVQIPIDMKNQGDATNRPTATKKRPLISDMPL